MLSLEGQQPSQLAALAGVDTAVTVCSYTNHHGGGGDNLLTVPLDYCTILYLNW